MKLFENVMGQEEFKLDLQLFAEEDGENPEGAEGTNPEGTESGEGEEEGKKDEPVNMTKEELEAMLQKEGDRRVSEARKKMEAKLKEDMKKEIQKAQEEKERIAKLSEKEREQEELKKRQEELEEKEKELARKEILSEAREEMSNRNLPSKFADYIVKEDTTETFEAIKEFETEWKDAVEKAVVQRIGTKGKKKGADNLDDLDGKNFKDLSYKERVDLKKKDPEGYAKLVREATKK